MSFAAVEVEEFDTPVESLPPERFRYVHGEDGTDEDEVEPKLEQLAEPDWIEYGVDQLQCGEVNQFRQDMLTKYRAKGGDEATNVALLQIGKTYILDAMLMTQFVENGM